MPQSFGPGRMKGLILAAPWFMLWLYILLPARMAEAGGHSAVLPAWSASRVQVLQQGFYNALTRSHVLKAVAVTCMEVRGQLLAALSRPFNRAPDRAGPRARRKCAGVPCPGLAQRPRG
jgi:hypothetical protein